MEVNDFLRAFKKCEKLSYPLPTGITNYGIAELVYGAVPRAGSRNENIEYPDYESDAKLMATRKNMTLVFLWDRYSKKCTDYTEIKNRVFVVRDMMSEYGI